MVLRQGNKLTSAGLKLHELRKALRIDTVGIVYGVAEKKAVTVGIILIRAHLAVIFSRRAIRGQSKAAYAARSRRIAGQSLGRQRIKGEVRLHAVGDPVNPNAAHYGSIAPRGRGRNAKNLRYTERLAHSFIGYEE